MNDVTVLLHEWRNGSQEAENKLFELLAPQLNGIARCLMRGERKGHTLQPTELVNQVYLRLVKAKDRDWQNRQHFLAVTARAMRRYLVDHARSRRNRQFVDVKDLQQIIQADDQQPDLVITIDNLLDVLAQDQPDLCRVVELKYFLGLTDEEAAEAMGIKLRSMQRMWAEARRWLFSRLQRTGSGE